MKNLTPHSKLFWGCPNPEGCTTKLDYCHERNMLSRKARVVSVNFSTKRILALMLTTPETSLFLLSIQPQVAGLGVKPLLHSQENPYLDTSSAQISTVE